MIKKYILEVVIDDDCTEEELENALQELNTEMDRFCDYYYSGYGDEAIQDINFKEIK